MKSVLIIFSISAFFISSCTKCVTCKETSEKGFLVTEYRETCGNAKEVTEFENTVHAQAIKTSTIECKRKSKVPFVGSGD